MGADYAHAFGLTARAFEPAPDPRFHFSSLAQRKAVSAVSYALNRGSGIAVLTGAPGLGKSSLLAHMTEQISGQPVTLASATGGEGVFVAQVARALGLSPPDDKGYALSAIEAFLVEEMRRGQRALLLVDDGEALSDEAAGPLSMLAKMRHGERSLLQVVMVGTEALASRLTDADWAGVREQTVASNSFEPLQSNEVDPYLRHRLSQAGWTGTPAIDPGLAPLLHEATGGVPSAINRAMSVLLDRAADDGSEMIDGDALAAWLDVDGEGSSDADHQTTPTEPDSEPPVAATGPVLAEAQLAAIEHAFAEHERKIAKLRREVAELRDQPAPPPQVEPSPNYDDRFEAIEARLNQHEQALKQMLERLIDYFEGAGSGPR